MNGYLSVGRGISYVIIFIYNTDQPVSKIVITVIVLKNPVSFQ